MWVWAILDEAQLDLFEHAPYYWASWWALGLKVHVGYVLGLEHDLGLDVGPSYKPCWDHINDHRFLYIKALCEAMIIDFFIISGPFERKCSLISLH